MKTDVYTQKHSNSLYVASVSQHIHHATLQIQANYVDFTWAPDITKYVHDRYLK